MGPAAEALTIAWLAGLCEGECSFLRPAPSRPASPMVDLEMTDEPVIARVAGLLGVRYRRRDRRALKPNSQVTYHVRVSGRRAVQLMLTLRPWMSPRRQAQIDRAVAPFFAARPAETPTARAPFVLVLPADGPAADGPAAAA